MTWTATSPRPYYAKAIYARFLPKTTSIAVSPFYFREVECCTGLDFPPYCPSFTLPSAQRLLVWLDVRPSGSRPRFPASPGTLSSLVHMAAFDIYLKPMYAFDSFCATFCLLAIFSICAAATSCLCAVLAGLTNPRSWQ